MLTDRLEPLLRFHPFTRLNALLQDLSPGGSGAPLLFSVGEPQIAPPPILRAELDRHAGLWSRYPQATGTADFRAAVGEWLMRRYRLPAGLIDPDRHLLPAAGSREALFMIALSAVPEARGQGSRPAVLMPNPFYHVYAGAAAVAGAEPVFLPATRETGFLPDPDALDGDLLDRTALAYVCSPANPQGAVADPAYLQRWIELARRHDFVVAFDECYAEIYTDAPPPGALEACAALRSGGLESGGLGSDLANVMVFHSLSKRSGAAGLRSGFVAGDPRLVQRQAQLVNFGGVAPPLPVLAASAALWRDEAHVEAGRARYRENFAVAAEILGDRYGFARPAGGFFLWLDVGDGEAAARRLWAEAGVRVLPGAYMARPNMARPGGPPGADGESSPGDRYIRVALVYDAATTAEGLRRLVAVLDDARVEAGRDGARAVAFGEKS